MQKIKISLFFCCLFASLFPKCYTKDAKNEDETSLIIKRLNNLENLFENLKNGIAIYFITFYKKILILFNI